MVVVTVFKDESPMKSSWILKSLIVFGTFPSLTFVYRLTLISLGDVSLESDPFGDFSRLRCHQT